jgi:hypothetical protein
MEYKPLPSVKSVFFYTTLFFNNCVICTFYSSILNVYNTFIKVPHIICKKGDGDSYYLYLSNDHVLVVLNSRRKML